MAGLESVIQGALDAAREEGVVDAAEPDEVLPAEDGDEGEAEVETVVEGETPDGEEKPVVEGEEEAEGEKPVVTEEKPKEKKKEDEPPAEDEDLGPAKDKHGRENRLPHSRVVKITANKVRKAEAAFIADVAEALGVEPTRVTRENLKTGLAATFKDVTVMRERLAGFDELEPIMVNEPDKFITMLAKSNPRYAKFLVVLEDGFEAPARRAATVATEEPQPDVPITLPDGSKGMVFSVEGMKKRDTWLREQFLGEAEERFGKRIKPFEDARTTAQQSADLRREESQKLANLLTEAREDWDGFSEHEEAIHQEVLKSDKKIPLSRAIRQAYNKIVVKARALTEADVRKKVHKELAEAPESTSATPKGKTAKEVPIRGEDGQVVTGTEAVIRRELAKAKAAGLR